MHQAYLSCVQHVHQLQQHRIERRLSQGFLLLSTLSEHCCSGTTVSGALGGCHEKGPLASLQYHQFAESYIKSLYWNIGLRRSGILMTDWTCDTRLAKPLAVRYVHAVVCGHSYMHYIHSIFVTFSASLSASISMGPDIPVLSVAIPGPDDPYGWRYSIQPIAPAPAGPVRPSLCYCCYVLSFPGRKDKSSQPIPGCPLGGPPGLSGSLALLSCLAAMYRDLASSYLARRGPSDLALYLTVYGMPSYFLPRAHLLTNQWEVAIW